MTHPLLIGAAWTAMLAVLLAMLMLDVLRESMAGRYAKLTEILASDPGPRGLTVLVCLIAFNSIMQAVIHLGSSPEFRLAVLVLTGGYGLFFLAHQLVHLAKGERPGLHTILDLAHHVAGGLGTWGAWQWVRAA